MYQDLRADSNRDLKGVRIVVEGHQPSEAYFNGGGQRELHDIRSAGKSITSLLVGIAVDKKLIRGVRQPLTELVRSADSPHLARITLEHILTMRSGLAADDEDPSSPGNENRMDQASSWLDFALAVPVRENPGTRYQYCSLNAFLAGAAVEIASSKRLDEFAREHLFNPLGIAHFEWRVGPDGRVAGQGNLRITLDAMTRVGQLCLNQGQDLAGGRQQIVSREWIHRSLSPIVSISHTDPYADSYGYMWYSKTHTIEGRRVRVHFASGNGGNKIYVVPELRIVMAVASAAYGRGYGQRRSQEILKRVLAACGVASQG
jgi:CubicO group peptidase (beta-lactamase class C family)